MDLDRFWELVEAAAVAGDGKCQAQAEQLTAMLEQLPPEEIVSFERHFTQHEREPPLQAPGPSQPPAGRCR